MVRISYYLRNKIGRQVLEAEIKNKHRKKRALKRQLKENSECLANKIGFICKIVLYQKIKSVITNQKTRWSKTHYGKIERLKSDYRKYDKPKRRIVENIHNFSSYKLTPEEEHALSFSLNDHIPTKQNYMKIKTEFESFPSQHVNVGSTLFQRFASTLKSHWSDIENETKSDVGFSTLHNVDTMSVSDIETTSIQRYFNLVSTLVKPINL